MLGMLLLKTHELSTIMDQVQLQINNGKFIIRSLSVSTEGFHWTIPLFPWLIKSSREILPLWLFLRQLPPLIDWRFDRLLFRCFRTAYTISCRCFAFRLWASPRFDNYITSPPHIVVFTGRQFFTSHVFGILRLLVK